MLERQIATAIASCLDDNKAEDVVVLDLAGLSSLADYFVIATSRNNKHSAALAKHVEDDIWLAFERDVHHKEGHRNGDWVVLDYLDVIVHIFNEDKRDYYNLDKLWRDATTVDYSGADRHEA